MQLKEFLDYAVANNTIFKTGSVTCLAVKESLAVPVVFLAQLVHSIRTNCGSVESIDLDQSSFAQTLGQLQTSFLGMSLTYYLRNAHELDKKNRQLLFEFLSHYSGPHKILLCALNEDAIRLNAHWVIEVPQTVHATAVTSLVSFMKKKNNAQTQKFIQELCNSYSQISLDQACMIISYMQVIGKFDESVNLLERILESEKSLFALSQYFFAHDAERFFKLWGTFEAEYPMTFWCTYWSEQLWRAYYSFYYLERNQPTQAKSIGYRLPFSFLQKDWKKNSREQLRRAHQSIYELDLAYKNNIETQAGIELFYSKFFLQKF